MADLPFTPCSPDCPAVTGQPNGSVRYCAMQEHARHRGMPRLGSESPRKLRVQGAKGIGPEAWLRDADGKHVWVIRDWRDGQDKPVRVVPVPDKPDWVNHVHDVPVHPDYTDCCANFQCCEDLWASAGLTSVKDAFVAGAPCVEIVKREDRVMVVVPGGKDRPPPTDPDGPVEPVLERLARTGEVVRVAATFNKQRLVGTVLTAGAGWDFRVRSTGTLYDINPANLAWIETRAGKRLWKKARGEADREGEP